MVAIGYQKVISEIDEGSYVTAHTLLFLPVGQPCDNFRMIL